MEAVTLPRRELTILAVALVAASRLVDGLPGLLVVGCVFVAVLFGTRRVLGSPPGRPAVLPLVLPLILPATAAAGAAAALHVLDFDAWLVVGLAAVGVLVDRALALEASLSQVHAARDRMPGAGSRTADLAEALGLALLVAFVAFVGVGALVPGGLAEPARTSGSAATPLPAGWLAALALGDAAVAGLIGLRLSGIRTGDVRDVAWSAGTYAAIAGVAAAALRALAMPRFLGPALLTLLLYLWSAYRGSTRATRRSARWIWESALLALLAVLVVAWNVAVRP